MLFYNNTYSLFIWLVILIKLPNLVLADFTIAFTTAVEQQPAVAYNTQSGDFLVAYLKQVGADFQVRVRRFNASGIPQVAEFDP